MSYDPNAPVIQNAHVIYGPASATTTSGPLVGVIRILRAEFWKMPTLNPTGWVCEIRDMVDPAGTYRTLMQIEVDALPDVGTLVVDFEGAILTNDSIVLVNPGASQSKVTYTID